MTQKTRIAAKPETERWLIIDAKDVILGRLATQVATWLRDKDQPTFSPHQPGATHVIVVNAADIKVTGDKLEQKRYYWHGRQPGTLHSRTLTETLERFPTRPVEEAIRRMLPDNKLRSIWMTRLHVYPDDQHRHEAQQPKEVKLG